MFPGYKNLSEFEKRKVQDLRRKMSNYSDFEFKVYIVLYSCIEKVTGKNTDSMNFSTNLHDVCNEDLKNFEKIYYSTCHNCLIPLTDNHLQGRKAYNMMQTIGELYHYMIGLKHL